MINMENFTPFKTARLCFDRNESAIIIKETKCKSTGDE